MEKIVGKCSHCGDPIYEFQITAHSGCAKIAGMKEVVEFVTNEIFTLPNMTPATLSVHFKDRWNAFLKEKGIG